MLDPHASVVADLAAQLTDRVAGKAIRGLQRRGGKDLLPGVKGGLKSAWDEVCVQVQKQESALSHMHVVTLRGLIARDVEKLTTPELQALWLQTHQGEDWWTDLDESWDGVPYEVDDIVDHILDQVIAMAASWSNKRIAAHVAGSPDR
jgi:hypothetical protein